MRNSYSPYNFNRIHFSKQIMEVQKFDQQQVCMKPYQFGCPIQLEWITDLLKSTLQH